MKKAYKGKAKCPRCKKIYNYTSPHEWAEKQITYRYCKPCKLITSTLSEWYMDNTCSAY